MSASLPRRVVVEDSRLEKTASRTTEELAKLRWHWTLDERNPDRVGMRDYARAVGRSMSTINVYARGYENHQSDRGTSISDAISRAQVSADKADAIDALAKASGRTFETTRRASASEVRTVRAIAEERAERRGTTAADELAHAAKAVASGRNARQAETRSKRNKRTLRYIEVEGYIGAAVRKLTQALEVTKYVEFDEEEVELLTDSLAKLRALLGLIDMSVAGETDVDWDAELAVLR